MLDLIPWSNGNGWTLLLDKDTAQVLKDALQRALGRMVENNTPQAENIDMDSWGLDIEMTP